MEVIMINCCYKVFKKNFFTKYLWTTASAANIFLFLILCFPKSKSISGIIRRRYDQSSLRKIRKFGKVEYRLRKIKTM